MTRKKMMMACAWLAAGALLTLSGCNCILRTISSESVGMDYVGTVSLGRPVTLGKWTTIPVTFSGGRWYDNSAIVFKKFKIAQNKDEVVVTAVTSLAAGRMEKSAILLKNLKPGKYQIVYLDPDGTRHPLGLVSVQGTTPSP